MKTILRNKTTWKKINVCSLIGMSMFLTLIPAYLFAQNIEGYQQIAGENNPEVQSAFFQYLSALEEENIVGVLPDPEIAFAYFISPIETRVGPQQARISLTQMFPWFGTLEDKRTISQSKAKAGYEGFVEARNRLFYQVEHTLLELYALDQSIRIADENLDILNSLVEISLRRYETDQVSQVDVLRAQIEQEDLKTRIALLRDNRMVLVRQIKELLNTGEDLEIKAPQALDPVSQVFDTKELIQEMENRNPGLNKLRYTEYSARERKLLAEKQGKPSFGIGLDYIFTGERANQPSLTDNGKDALMARVGVQIPLFRKKYNAQVRQAELNIQSVELQITNMKNNLQTDLESSLRDFQDANRRFELYDRKQIQRVNQALSIMTQQYATDSSDFEEILRMQRNLLEYQFSRVRALTDMHQARAYIDYIIGTDNISPQEIN